MTKTSETIIFFGNERLVSGLKSTDAPILKGLIKAGYTVAAIVSHYSASQSRNNRELEVGSVAREHNIPLLTPTSPSDIIEDLAKYNADAGVLVAYGKIIPQRIIDIFPHGIINIHPSLLPKYRGPTPIEAAILNGDDITGVSIMQLSAEMDAGPVYAQQEVNLTGAEDKFMVYEALVNVSTNLLIRTLPSVLNGELIPKPQQHNDATFSQLLSKTSGIIDPSKPAIQLEREIRAYIGWPKSRANIFNQDVVITKAHVAPSSQTPLDILSGDGTYLVIDELVAPSGKTVNAQAFLNGYSVA